MSKQSILTFIAGLVFMGLIILGLMVTRDEIHKQESTASAFLDAQTYSVGSDVSGIITQQLVHKGEVVEQDQELFHLKSSQLLGDMNEGKLKSDDLLYPLNENRELIIRSARKGVIKELHVTEGSFVVANKELAKVIDLEGIYVNSQVKLSRNQLLRLNPKSEMKIELPNGDYLLADIDFVAINSAQSRSKKIDTTISSVPIDLNFISNILIGSPLPTQIVFNDRELLSTKLHTLFSHFKTEMSKYFPV